MSEATPTKHCPRCDSALPLSNFSANRAMRDGLQIHCRACRLEINREHRERHPEKAKVWGRDNMRRRRERDPDAVREYQREWRAANAERTRETRRAWAEANYEQMRLKAREANRRWKASHPEAVRAEDARRRATLVRVGEVDLRALWISQCGLCALCGERIDDSLPWPDPMSKSLDHIVPLARGGEHSQRNLQYVHLVENLRKGARLIA